MKTIEIFKPGRVTAGDGRELDFTQDDLKAIAAAYDPSLHEAPLVIGHPKADLPAHGWVKRVEFSETDRRLKVEPDQVEAQFAEMVKTGRFKKISASFYTPDSPRNPAPIGPNGKKPYYLRHVGFLGAMPPAVAGLKSVDFNETEDGVAIVEFAESDSTLAWMFRSLREWIISKWNRDEAEKALPGYAVAALERAATEQELRNSPSSPASVGFAEPTSKEEPMPPTAEELAAKEASLSKKEVEFSESEKALKTRESELEEREKRIKADEARVRKNGFVDFVESLVKAGKVLPAQKANLVEFMSAIADTGIVEFAEGDKKTQKPVLDFFKDFLNAMPKQVSFGEIATGDQLADESPDDLAKRAVEFQESERKAGRIISTTDAVTHVKKGLK